MTKLYYRPLIYLAILSFFSLSCSRNTLTPTQSLFDGETLISSGGAFALGFFTPSNSNNKHRYVGIWYHDIPGHTVIWVANRGHPIIGTTGILSITTNGTLIITEGVNSTIIWSFALAKRVTNPIAQLLDIGNFVVSNDNDPNNYAWQSFDYPSDTLIPGMKLGWNLTSGLNRNLTHWFSATDPSSKNYTIGMDLSGDPQLRLWIGSTRAMRSGPWTGQAFNDLLPFNNSYASQLQYNFVNNQDEVYFTFDVVNHSTIAREVLTETGSFQLFIWADSGQWSLYIYNPRTKCDDALSLCGTYGVCNADILPICSCLPGFLPKSKANWELRIWSDGCIRKTTLDCKNGTDEFVTVHQTFLPDTVSATVDRTLSLDECKSKCLKNCSCTAFAGTDIRGGGSGCIMWFADLEDTHTFTEGGKDLYIRLAAADIHLILSQSHKSRKSTSVVELSTVMGTLLLALVVCFTWRRRKHIRGNIFSRAETILGSSREGEIELPLFDLGTIVAATNNFSTENKLGEGGFGPVYKGKTTEGQEIAVKRLSKTSEQGLDELKTEVMLVAKLQHRNLVRLLGYCIQGDERMLLYEYMPNKSLDTFLFDEEKGVMLDWRKRYQIIHGIARGLLYLHQDSRFRIIHRDLKASNILLDKDMNPKISDFGLARIFGEDVTKTKTRRVVGTYGYMSPEYALNGIFSTKSDVFSFGVLVLEIVSGQRNNGVYLCDWDEYLLAKAWTLWNEGKGVQLVDASLDGSVSVTEILRCIKVGLLCIQEHPRDRPTMSSVVLMLGSDHAFLPEPKQPGFVSQTSSSKEHSHSINDVTNTMSIAR